MNADLLTFDLNRSVVVLYLTNECMRMAMKLALRELIYPIVKTSADHFTSD